MACLTNPVSQPILIISPISKRWLETYGEGWYDLSLHQYLYDFNSGIQLFLPHMALTVGGYYKAWKLLLFLHIGISGFECCFGFKHSFSISFSMGLHMHFHNFY
jgi:hypothetical protein